MLRTPVCDLLDIEVPIMQAAIWPATAPKLVAEITLAPRPAPAQRSREADP